MEVIDLLLFLLVTLQCISLGETFEESGNKRIGENCETDWCIDPLFCDLKSTPPECKCPPATPNWNRDKEVCEVKGPGSACDTSAVASDCAPTLRCTREGNCQCQDDLQWDGEEKCMMKVGGDCTTGEQCLPNAECLEGKCVCGAYYALNEEHRTCDTKIATIHGKCIVRRDCFPQKGLYCIGGKCSCAAGFEWAEERCKLTADLLSCNSEEEVSETRDNCAGKGIENLECAEESDSGRCACPSNSVYFEAAKACRLKAGEGCTVGTTVHHGFCYSGHCAEGKYIKLHAKCDCHDGRDGQRRIWRSDPPGCVDDKFGYPCFKDQDCHLRKAKRGRKGLSCHAEEERCLCDPGYTYQGAYCVKEEDTKGHGSPCSLKGYPACNMTGTGLACIPIAHGKDHDHECQCMPKHVKDQDRNYLQMVWDATQGKCDLKAEGQECYYDNECRGGRCRFGKCDAGAKVVASAYAGVMMLMICVLRRI